MLGLRTERENEIICYKYRNEISIVATNYQFNINKCNDDFSIYNLFP